MKFRYNSTLAKDFLNCQELKTNKGLEIAREHYFWKFD